MPRGSPPPVIGSLGVQRFVPFGACHPSKRRKFAAYHSPFKIIPPEILFAVLSLDSSSGFSRFSKNRLLCFGQWFFSSLDPIEPILVAIPPYFVPELFVSCVNRLVTSS